MSLIDRNCSHLAGEYFVAAELYRRGYSVGITIGNAKAIDIFIEKGTKTLNIQVKTIYSKKSVGWPITKKEIISNIVYIFVCLNGIDKQPDYFICTSDEARTKVKQYKIREIIDLSSLRSNDFINRWDKIEMFLKRPIP